MTRDELLAEADRLDAEARRMYKERGDAGLSEAARLKSEAKKLRADAAALAATSAPTGGPMPTPTPPTGTGPTVTHVHTHTHAHTHTGPAAPPVPPAPPATPPATPTTATSPAPAPVASARPTANCFDRQTATLVAVLMFVAATAGCLFFNAGRLIDHGERHIRSYPGAVIQYNGGPAPAAISPRRTPPVPKSRTEQSRERWRQWEARQDRD